MSTKLRNWITLIVIVTLVLAADQISKNIVQRNMYLGQSIDVIDPFFAITYSENSGASFGFLPQAGDIFLMLAFVIAIGIFIFYPRIPPKRHAHA
ncbi:MAG: Signal peptidase II, partial [Chlorobi bacterium OLB7]